MEMGREGKSQLSRQSQRKVTLNALCVGPKRARYGRREVLFTCFFL